MIKGNIDLTENLDFLHDKKSKELPSVVPWNIHGEISKNHYRNTSTIRLNTNYNLTTFNSTTVNNYYISRRNNDQINITTISNNSSISTITLQSSYISNNNITTNSYSSYDNLSTAIAVTYYTNTISTTTDTGYINYNNIYIEPSKYPWEYKNNKHRNSYAYYKLMHSKRNRSVKSCSDIFFNKKDHEMESIADKLSKGSFYRDIDDIYSITEITENISHDSFRLRHRNDKPRRYHDDRKIPWLRKLNSRIYSDYIRDLYEDDHDYSKYLTDYGWIGIHDV